MIIDDSGQIPERSNSRIIIILIIISLLLIAVRKLNSNLTGDLCYLEQQYEMKPELKDLLLLSFSEYNCHIHSRQTCPRHSRRIPTRHPPPRPPARPPASSRWSTSWCRCGFLGYAAVKKMSVSRNIGGIRVG